MGVCVGLALPLLRGRGVCCIGLNVASLLPPRACYIKPPTTVNKLELSTKLNTHTNTGAPVGEPESLNLVNLPTHIRFEAEHFMGVCVGLALPLLLQPFLFPSLTLDQHKVQFSI